MSDERPSRRIARVSWQIAALGCFVLALRLAWLTQREFAPDFASSSSEPTRRRREKESAPASASSAPSPPPAASVPTGPPQVRMLYVKLGPPRSAVYVNGVRMGETPYAGDWSCNDGDPIAVQVVPPSGPPLHRNLRCAGTTLVVRERQMP